MARQMGKVPAAPVGGWSLLGVVLCLASGAAGAAGGHHAVDDAALLDEGRCKLEGWFERAAGGARLFHAATGCRIGPVELAIGADHERASGASQTSYGVGVKWATALVEGLSVGASAGPQWQSRARPRYQGTAVVGLVTWEASETVNLHLNAGRDLVHRGSDAPRGGVAIDWSPAEGWQLVAERFRQDGAHFVRAGVRWTPAADWTIDLSRAHRLRGDGASSWTLGLTREFGR